MPPENPSPVEQLLAGWNEEDEDPYSGTSHVEEASSEPEQAEEQEEPEAAVAEEEESVEERDEGDEDDAGEEEEGEGEEVSAEYGPDVLAFLQKYGGDEKQALKAAAELYRMIGRRDEEKQRVEEERDQYRAALVEAQALMNGGEPPLNEAQREWVEGAALAANPGVFIQQAVNEQQFALARAVCREWAHSNPYEALRAGQYVDVREMELQQAYEQQRMTPVKTEDVVRAMGEQFPEMRPYFNQMGRVAEQLGDDHPLVLEARSQNSQEAVRGMTGLYEIARASSAAVSETREEVKRRAREAGDRERAKGVVSSTTNSPSPKETPRQTVILPGLTLEQLDTEFARS